MPPLVGKIRVLRKDLSKSTGPIGRGAGGIGTTPRGAINGNFSRAVRAAVEDTADKWAYFRERVMATYGRTRGATIICMLQRDGYDPKACEQRAVSEKVCSNRELAAELLAEAPIHLLNALFCLAILKLNYQLLPEPAARIFAAVHYACRGKLKTGRDREAATGLLWDSGYNRVFAYKVAGQAKPMQAAAKELLAPPTDLPPIPERVAESVQSLVA